MSLADAFAGQQAGGGAGADQQQRAGGSAGGATLSSESLNTLFEQCIRLAAENKITDRNVWQLNLISHLPDIVVAGAGAGAGAAGSGSGGRGFNFQKMSGGLDAGVAGRGVWGVLEQQQLAHGAPSAKLVSRRRRAPAV